MRQILLAHCFAMLVFIFCNYSNIFVLSKTSQCYPKNIKLCILEIPNVWSSNSTLVLSGFIYIGNFNFTNMAVNFPKEKLWPSNYKVIKNRSWILHSPKLYSNWLSIANVFIWVYPSSGISLRKFIFFVFNVTLYRCKIFWFRQNDYYGSIFVRGIIENSCCWSFWMVEDRGIIFCKTQKPISKWTLTLILNMLLDNK